MKLLPLPAAEAVYGNYIELHELLLILTVFLLIFKIVTWLLTIVAGLGKREILITNYPHYIGKI